MVDSNEIAEYAIANLAALQKKWELSTFLDFITSRDCKVVYEIGTSLGGTLWAMAMALPGERTFVSIDLPNGPFGGSGITPDEIADIVEDANALATTIVIPGDSKTVDLSDDNLPKPDLVFIDGDHTSTGVWGDWVRYSPKVNKGGIVAFHDIVEHPVETGVQVKTIWDMIKSSTLPTYEIIEQNGGSWGGIGIVYV